MGRMAFTAVFEQEASWGEVARAKVVGRAEVVPAVDFTKLEERKPEFAKLHAQGNGVGAIMNMDTAFTLADNGGGTDMKWEAEVRIAGPVGSMGQRVLQPIVNQQVNNVLTALDKQVMEAAGAGAEAAIHPASPEAYDLEAEGPTHSTEDS